MFDLIKDCNSILSVGNESIDFLSLKQKIIKISSLYKKGELYGFCKEINLNVIMHYLGAIYAGAYPYFVAHPSKKVSEEVYKERIEHLRNIGLTNILTDIPDQFSDNYNKEVRNKICFIQLSSGTTGNQKAYGIERNQLINHLEIYSKFLNLKLGDSICSWLPLYHDMGLITSLFLPLYVGANIHIIPTFQWIFNPVSILKKIDELNASHVWFPNFCFSYLQKWNYELKNKNCTFINCSEPCLQESVEGFVNKFGAKVVGCYAMAENVFVVSQASNKRYVNGLLSCGEPIKNVKIKINKSGEILIGGPFLYKWNYNNGFIKNNNKWFNTKDIGFLDSKELFISGRTKEMFIVNGKNVFANYIEEIIGQIPGMHPGRSIIFPMENEGTQKIVCLYEADMDVSEEIKLRVSDLFDINISPIRTKAGTLIKTSSGKLSRNKNQKIYEKKIEIINFIMDYVRKETGNFVQSSSYLYRDGIIDSITFCQLLTETALHFNKEIDWEKDFRPLSLGELSDEYL